jgi:hypothetical protein
MAKTVSSMYQSQASVFEIFGGLSGKETDFSQTISIFPFHYQSTILHKFKSVLKVFHQLLTIHGLSNGHYVPLTLFVFVNKH